MPELIPADSVGLVAPIAIPFDQPLSLNCGEQLDKFQLMVETYGELNQSRSNGVLICHALSGHHHAAGYHSMADRKPGWWDNFIGPGKPIDTRRFFVVALNNLGDAMAVRGRPASIPKPANLMGQTFRWSLSQTGLTARSCWLTIWVFPNGLR